MIKLPKPRQKSQSYSSRPNFSYYSGAAASKDKPSKPGGFAMRLDVAKRLGLRLIFLAFLAGIFYFGLTLSGRVQVIPSSTAYRSDAAYYQAVVRQAGSFKNRSKLTFDDKDLAQNIQSQFPEVANVTIELPLISRQPKVRLDISLPAADIVDNHGNKYILASDGKVVMRAHGPALLTIQDASSLNLSIGEQVLSTDQISFINTVKSQLLRSGVVVRSIVLPPIAQEVDIYPSKVPYFVKFLLNGDANQQAGSFLATRHYLATHHSRPSQYVDVRVAGKVFYK